MTGAGKLLLLMLYTSTPAGMTLRKSSSLHRKRR